MAQRAINNDKARIPAPAKVWDTSLKNRTPELLALVRHLRRLNMLPITSDLILADKDRVVNI